MAPISISNIGKSSLSSNWKNIRILLLDVDGVLTDGRIVYGDEGSEIKAFNAKDGLGLRLLMDKGIDVGIITGRSSKALVYRCSDLGIRLIYQNVQDKTAVLDEICSNLGIVPVQCAFVGDDLPDIPIMKRVGLSVAVADAHETVIAASDIVTSQKGGEGAVREVCEALLKLKGQWQQLIADFTNTVD